MNHEHENETILMKTFEGISSDEVSAEYNLPDYLPDINRLLKVSAKISESNHYLAGDAVEYDGTLKCMILYATGDGTLKNTEFEREFSGMTTVSGTSGDCDIHFEPHIDSITCRLQNPRKLTAKCKLALSTSVYCTDLIAPAIIGKLNTADEKSLEARTHSIAAMQMTIAEEKNTPISEDIELDSTLPAMEEIISVEMEPYIAEIRASENKVIYKGDILADILYLSAKTEDTPAGMPPHFVSFTAKIPITGEIEAPGISERYIPFASVIVSTPEFRTQTNAFGENRTIELDFDYHVSAELYCNEETILTTDMYSTAYESTCEEETLAYNSVFTAKSFNFTAEGNIKSDDSDFHEIVMTTAAVSVAHAEKTGNKLWFTGTANVSVILTNGEGIYLSKNFEIPLRAETDGTSLTHPFDIRTQAMVLSASGKLDGDTIHVNLETFISYILFEKHTETHITKLSVWKEKPISSKDRSSLLLCYPAIHDTLWDIAKKYSITTAALMEANNISAETTPQVLMIPKKPISSEKGYRIL